MVKAFNKDVHYYRGERIEQYFSIMHGNDQFDLDDRISIQTRQGFWVNGEIAFISESYVEVLHARNEVKSIKFKDIESIKYCGLA